MALRFDTGEVKSVHKSPEGFLIVKGTATRTGVFTYRNSDGTLRRELRHPDDVLSQDSLATLAGKPLTLEHPPELLTPDNVEQYSVGSVGNKVHIVGNGLIEIVGNVHRRDAIAAIESKSKRDLSCGYTCEIVREDGIYNGEPHDFRQKNIVYNHLAHVTQGRAGIECGLHLDSVNDEDIATQVAELHHEPIKKRMGTSINLDGVTYQDVPETFAHLTVQVVKERDTLRSRVDSLEAELEVKTTEVDTLEEQNEDLEIERDRERGRGDALELQLEEAKEQLFDREDGSPKKKKKTTEWDMEPEESMPEKSDEEEVDPEDMTEENYKAWLKKKKRTKSDSSELEFMERMDAWQEAVQTWEVTEKLIPGFRQDHFDNSLTASGIQKLALAKLKPQVNWSQQSDIYVKGRFDALLEDVLVTDSLESVSSDSERTDATDYSSQLYAAVGMARSGGRKPNSQHTNQESIKRMSQNWQTPLAMSKK